MFPLVRPDIPVIRAWKRDTKSAYRNGMFSNGGNNWKALNAKAESFFPGSKAIGVANNTVGQIAALQALKVRNEIVFLSNFTFPATLQAILQAGGIPVVCDIDPRTWELSEESIKTGIREYGKPKVVLHTRVFGKRENLTQVATFLKSEGIQFLLDSAAAFPSEKIDTLNLNEVFSLHATKALGVGEGGIIVGEPDFIDETWRRCNFGFLENQHFSDGSNAKMDEFTAARAVASLNEYTEICEKRRSFVKLSYGEIINCSEVVTVQESERAIWSLFPIRFKTETALLKFKEHSMNHGLTGKRYYAPSLADGYNGEYEVKYVSNIEESQLASKLTYCLPVYSRYTRKESRQIMEITLEAISKVNQSI